MDGIVSAVGFVHGSVLFISSNVSSESHNMFRTGGILLNANEVLDIRACM